MVSSRIYFWENILSGDINVDHNLNVLDLVSMVELIVNPNSFSDEMMYIIDINQDIRYKIITLQSFDSIEEIRVITYLTKSDGTKLYCKKYSDFNTS